MNKIMTISSDHVLQKKNIMTAIQEGSENSPNIFYCLGSILILKPLTQVGPRYSQVKINLDDMVGKIKKTEGFQDLKERWYVD